MKASFLRFALTLVCLLHLESSIAQLTNHVEIVPGVFFDLVNRLDGEPANVFHAHDRIGYSISCTRTNVLLNRLPENQTFSFKLYDSSLYEIPKTKAGLAMSNVPDPDKSAKDLNVRLRIFGRPSITYGTLFKPQEYFVISNRGEYTLEVSMRVWTELARRKYGLLVSSAVRVRVVEP